MLATNCLYPLHIFLCRHMNAAFSLNRFQHHSAGFWTNHPAVVKAIQEQSEKLLHCSNLYWIENQVKLAKLLVENLGSFYDHGTDPLVSKQLQKHTVLQTSIYNVYAVHPAANSLHAAVHFRGGSERY